MILTFRVARSPEVVLDYLTDPELFARVHPVVHRMEPLSEGRFRVHETIRMGPIPYSFTYEATVAPDPGALRVVMEFNVRKAVHVTLDFRLRGEGNGTVVEEEVTLRSRLPLGPLMRSLFREQHGILFSNIEADVG
jgi:carbon monoxide dehydrogenase subunit G